jgi:hypothetical protein
MGEGGLVQCSLLHAHGVSSQDCIPSLRLGLALYIFREINDLNLVIDLCTSGYMPLKIASFLCSYLLHHPVMRISIKKLCEYLCDASVIML